MRSSECKFIESVFYNNSISLHNDESIIKDFAELFYACQTTI